MPLGTEVGLVPSNFVLDGNPAPPPQKGAEPPIFGHVSCGQTAEWINMALGMELGFGTGHIVLDGDQLTLPRKGDRAPNFRPISIVAKRLDASRCHLVQRQVSAQATLCYMGTQLLAQKKAQLPLCGPYLLWPNDCMYQDITWYKDRPQPRRYCGGWGPNSSSPKGAEPPSFRPMSVVGKRT